MVRRISNNMYRHKHCRAILFWSVTVLSRSPSVILFTCNECAYFYMLHFGLCFSRPSFINMYVTYLFFVHLKPVNDKQFHFIAKVMLTGC